SRALAYAIVGDRAAAEQALAIAISQDRDSSTTWDIAVVLRHHWGEPIDRLLEIDRVLRGSPLATAAPTVGDLTYDIASFRVYPRDGLVSPATRLFGDRPYPWYLERLLPPS
ncbi:MAG TPA: hypothetical protein VFM74_02705, partial [Candidatus Limnocylindria bacterium]|nr:hypothetical protein [Candidatus Limnocylindria bacterium]